MAEIRVHLVGAGPGDPGLFTQRGLSLLRQADVVIADHLVNPELLLETRSNVEIIRVDATFSHDREKREELVRQLVLYASTGKRVVRLKGGDCFLFGRGAEEAEALLEAGIPFEVVPGVSSAFAVPAAAGIPLTDRRYAHSVLLATGHAAEGESAVDFTALANQADTLVVLMSKGRLGAICAELIEGGLDPQTPAAMISRGTTPSQRSVIGVVCDIADRVESSHLALPALLVVGTVVTLREKLSMFEDRPLFGKRVVITRPRSQSQQIVQRLMELGAQPVLLPTIRLADIEPDKAGLEALARLPDYDGIFFTSTNAVRRTFEELERLGMDSRSFTGVLVISVGAATATALKERGLVPDVVPITFSQEGICEALSESGVKGQVYLYPRAESVRETLRHTIPEQGGRLVDLILYRTETVPETSLPDPIQEGLVDVVTFTSPSTVRGFFERLGSPRAEEILGNTLVLAIGQTTKAALVERGVADVHTPDRSTVDDMVDQLCTLIGDTGH